MNDLSRQERTFSTKALEKAKVGVIGSGPISNFLCAYLSGLGIGTIVLSSDDESGRRNPAEWVANLSRKRTHKAGKIADTLTQMNGSLHVLPYFSRPHSSLLYGCDVVVDTTNSRESKYLAWAASMEDSGRLVSCSSSRLSASVCSLKRGNNKGIGIDDIVMGSYSGLVQGSFTSALAAAIAADEVRKTVCPVEGDMPLQSRINYSAFLDGRFSSGALKVDLTRDYSAQGKKALVVGAGGIGTYVLLCLAMDGVGTDLFEGDFIEGHNLNRQMLYFGKTGESKAKVAAERLRLINPSIQVTAHDGFAEYDALKELAKENRYDVVFSCVDSFSARQMLNRFCTVNRIPLINGAVTTFDALVDAYMPGKTHCLECRNDYERKKSADNVRISCNDLPANVVMPNAMSGALMFGEALHALCGEEISCLGDARLSYSTNASDTGKGKVMRTALGCGMHGSYSFGCRCHYGLGEQHG